jgi:ParB family chromosome partitioning protein
LIGLFIAKYAEHVRDGDISEGIVLVNNATETGWFDELVSVSSAAVFPKGRVRFLDPDGNPGAPLQGQAVVYAGGNPEKFLLEFGCFGWGAKL